MNNGSNSWGISFSRITWLEDAIKNHGNIISVTRHDDIIIDAKRNSGPRVIVICLDDYALGESGVLRVFKEFPEVNFISVGGNWNGYTPEAKKLCLSKQIGLYNSSELNGALFKNDFWTYHKCDKKGNPSYPYKTP